MQDYSEDRKWSDHFLLQIKGIIGETLVGAAPDVEDRLRNTDLIVLGLNAIRVACRVRRAIYLARYADQFTIRTDRSSGRETEFDKLVSGFGDYIFYGFGSDSHVLQRWFIGDLSVFRAYVHTYVTNNGGKLPGVLQGNDDRKSAFRAFCLADMPASFVVRRYALPERKAV